MRCLALGQAARSAGWTVLVAAAELPSPLVERFIGEGIRVELLSLESPGDSTDVEATARLARDVAASWVVVDGYQFSTRYSDSLRTPAIRILLIDDDGTRPSGLADLIVNQNLDAHESMYGSRSRSSRLLLGPRYVLLRKEFLRHRIGARNLPQVGRRVLVTLGGADPGNVTRQVVDALKTLASDSVEAQIVIGPSNPRAAAVEADVALTSMRIRRNVDDIADLMAWADLAVLTGGSTCWEAARMGLPALVIIAVAHQAGVVNALHRLGIARSLGWHDGLDRAKLALAITDLLTDPNARREMSLRGPTAIDGRGAERVLAAMVHDRN
jgi:UDP-2,4-diacetamido-2,4,6-trideoxy-beta-L-altropyranose hydrolase